MSQNSCACFLSILLRPFFVCLRFFRGMAYHILLTSWLYRDKSTNTTSCMIPSCPLTSFFRIFEEFNLVSLKASLGQDLLKNVTLVINIGLQLLLHVQNHQENFFCVFCWPKKALSLQCINL